MLCPPSRSVRTGLEFLTVAEIADRLHVGRDKVYRLIRTGQLRSIKIGKLRRIYRRWVTEFVEHRQRPGNLRAPSSGTTGVTVP